MREVLTHSVETRPEWPCQNLRMHSNSDCSLQAPPKAPRRRATACSILCALSVWWAAPLSAAQSQAGQTNHNIHGFSYRRDVIPEAPWSVHIVKFDRSNGDFEFH